MTYEFKLDDHYITANISECRDAYGTGDSPTLYEVDLIEIINPDGNVLFESNLSRVFYDAIVDKAIRTYGGY